MAATDSTPDNEAGFAVEMRRWLEISGKSRTALAKQVRYDRSYISKIANGTEPGSLAVVRQCDQAMQAGGALTRAWQAEHGQSKPAAHPRAVDPGSDVSGLVVDCDHAELRFDKGVYRLTQRRRLTNHSAAPVNRYLIRIAVDRFPSQPERSNAHYRESPLTWEELDLHAWWGSDRSAPIGWTVQHDRDAFKEVWLRFETQEGRRFDLYPGQSTWLEYTYTVDQAHWGNWFRRAVRHTTRHLSITLDLPSSLDPAVWGLATSMTGDGMPLETPIGITQHGDRAVYTWSTEDPPLHSRFKLEWSFRHRADTAAVEDPTAAMAAIGIVQDGDPILRTTARPFDLPTEFDAANRVIAALVSAAERITTVHTFGKGRGIAAPQIGIDRSAAIVYPPGATEPVVLLNPVTVDASTVTDLQYEGCLSFFDVRCKVPRPLRIDVEHQDLDGHTRITEFELGTARLVAHEVDHLKGILCRDLLPGGEPPVPVEIYRGTGTAWQYPI